MIESIGDFVLGIVLGWLLGSLFMLYLVSRQLKGLKKEMKEAR
jgi:uncharacterized membrane protein YciS (DUF1049 family)